MSYQPLAGVKVLDLGILIPAALTSGKLAALGADMETEHFAARRIAEGGDGAWPNVTTAIRWHHTGERAGAGLTPPPAFDENREEVLRDWLR